ncbi:MAG: molybdenum cofactor guanylyltransferase [Verrucomicrobia bacterium]|nr:molybdenum cofactor guanylyltransferase [Verrucomicrobiota bacterium]MBV8482823.1 molybdenum cofactor guanylyltransferase [Verrucomicrobiota bacterium]
MNETLLPQTPDTSLKSLPPFSAALLAGGRSRRMGHDKRLLLVDSQGEPVPLWKRQLDILRKLRPVELLVSGLSDLEYPPDARVVPDKVENGGPLAGILSCLTVAQSKLLLVLAVDLPNMSSTYLSSLVQRSAPGCGVVPAIEQDLEPVAAVYPVEAAAVALTHLQQGQRSLQTFARQLEQSGLVSIQKVAPDDVALFRNWNSPEDLANSP